MRILLQPPTSFASKIGGQFATESYGQLHRNLQNESKSQQLNKNTTITIGCV